MDDMDFSAENIPNIDIVDSIDVRQILGLSDADLIPQQQQQQQPPQGGNF